jgi:hypothetical protein
MAFRQFGSDQTENECRMHVYYTLFEANMITVKVKITVAPTLDISSAKNPIKYSYSYKINTVVGFENESN